MPQDRRCFRTPNAATGSDAEDRLGRLLAQTVDFALAGSLFVVPMLMGARSGLARLALVVLAVAAAVAWALHQSLSAKGAWRRSAAEWLLLGGVLLLALQLAPWPASLLERATPHVSEILPLWGPGLGSPARLGSWSQVSLTPAATQSALVIFLAYGLLFLVTVQRVQRLEDVERLLRWCALSALVMAAFGIVQLVTSNGKFFWVIERAYAHTYGVAKGAFGNRNHFAHFLALGIGPLIWWVQHDLRDRRKRPAGEFGQFSGHSRSVPLGTSLRVVGLGVVLFAVLLSLSRGGALVTLLAVSICLAVCYRASSIGPKFLLGLGAVTLLIGVSLGVFGLDRVARRLDTLTSGSLETMDRGSSRRTIWSTVAKAIPDYPLLGSGVGSHREVYPMYLEQVNSEKYFSHAECGYLQVALEAGALGSALLVAGIGLCAFWCVFGLRHASSKRMLVCVGAVSAGLAASAVHSAVDFVWYIPGCMTMVVVLAACSCRLWQLATKQPTGRTSLVPIPRHVALVGVAVLLGVGTWMVKVPAGWALAEPHWESFLMLNQEEEPLPFGVGEPNESGTAEEYRSSLAAREKAVVELKQVVRWEPGHARAHLRLAEAYVRLFHQKQQMSANVMSVNQIRDAVLASRSEEVPPESRLDSRERLEQWLSVAVGEHYVCLDLALEHARRALTLCPLLGEGYLFLGELCFLEGGRESSKSAYVAQALKVRPFDGTVLLHAGSEAILIGDFDQGLAYWQDAFQRGSVYQAQIIDWLVGRIQPWDFETEIRFFLETFQPDLEALRLLEDRYRRIAKPEQMVSLRRVHVAAVEAEVPDLSGQEAADLWLEAMELYEKLGSPDQRLRCGREALRSDPNSVRVRESIANCLADLGEYDEAKTHFKWLVSRKPDEMRLHEKLKEINRIESELSRQAARPGLDEARLR